MRSSSDPERDRATVEVLHSNALTHIVASQGLAALLLVPAAWLVASATRLIRDRRHVADRRLAGPPMPLDEAVAMHGAEAIGEVPTDAGPVTGR